MTEPARIAKLLSGPAYHSLLTLDDQAAKQPVLLPLSGEDKIVPCIAVDNISFHVLPRDRLIT